MPVRSDLVKLRWLASEPAEQVARWYLLLDAGERVRAERFRMSADRDAFVAAHALLRATLSELTGRATDEWRFVLGPHGKPALAPGLPQLQFNISHTRGWVACAVANDPVGVDVERIDREAGEVAEVFSPREIRHLRGCAPEAFASELTRLWTLKEAFIKATGEGLHRPLDSFSFCLDPVRIRFRDSHDHAAMKGHWQFLEVGSIANQRLALAVCGRDASGVVVDARPADPHAIAPRHAA